MNMRLKMRLLNFGQPQIAVAHEIGISDSQLSKIVNGWVNPKQEIKNRLAMRLGCHVEDIFQETDQ